jgi:hypothetical protein
MADILGSRLLKVDFVASAGEAQALQAAGANVIGITVATGREDDPPRCVTLEMALAIRDAVTAARLCVTIDGNAEDVESALEEVRGLSPDLLQIPNHTAARDEWRDAIEAEGLPVVLDGEEISYEDDPAFIEQRFSHAEGWTGPLFQVSLLEDMNAPWQHLNTDAKLHQEDYIQLEDIGNVTRRYDVLVSMEGSPEDIRAMLTSLPDAKGVFLRLGSEGLDPTLAVLAALRA